MSEQSRKPSWLQVDPVVFFGSSAVIWLLLALSIFDEQWSRQFWDQLYVFTSRYFGWVYLVSVAFFVGVCIYLVTGPYGKIRLGKQDEKPEYAFFPWLAMLFSAGMGIGLVFNCVAEPVLHFQNPPLDKATDAAQAAQAMKLTYLHWGIHPWAIYSVVGLAVSFFHFRLGYPLSLRHTLRPLFGDRFVNGPVGYAVDILAVVGTLFGVAASLGFGAAQIESGLHYLFAVPTGVYTEVLIICGITAIALISVVSGLNKGIKYLSQLNILLAFCLFVFVLLAGNTIDILYATIHSIGDYMQELPRLTFNPAGKDHHAWLSQWTLTYWGWWIAWAPFVGIFIARISRGRTVSEFILGAVLAPSLFTFFWMSAFGEQAIALIRGGDTELASLIVTDKTVALFAFLEHLPFPSIVSFLAIFLIATFFITSSDSGSFVIDMIAAGGVENPPVKQKVYWAILEGAVASVLILAGGLRAIQSAALNAALPFCFVIILMCWSLLRALKEEVE